MNEEKPNGIYVDSAGKEKTPIAMDICPICGRSKAILVQDKSDARAFFEKALPPKVPCLDCVHAMDIGIIIIGTADEDIGKPNPRRSGDIRYISYSDLVHAGIDIDNHELDLRNNHLFIMAQSEINQTFKNEGAENNEDNQPQESQ